MHRVMIVGAGAQGNVLCGVLSRADDVAKILLVDRDLERAEEVAQFAGSSKIEVDRIDASNSIQMTEALKKGEFDLVVNATIPVFNRQILQAACNARTDYLDMASGEMLEKEGVLVDQFEFTKEFKETGGKAFILMGSDAGLVNIMAKEAADELDEIDYIGIKDYGIVECDEPVALWSMAIYLMDCAEPAVYWEDGQYRTAPLFSGEEEYYFPEPLGVRGKVYYHHHEEPVTIPRFIGKSVKYCDFKMGEPETDTWKFLIQGLGLMDAEPVEVNGSQICPRDVLLRKIPPTPTPKKLIDMVQNKQIFSRLQLAVDVKGKKGEQTLHFKMWTESPDVVQACERIPGASDVSWLTSVPASVASLMLLRGQIKHTGVFPAEVLDREERAIFFKEIRNWDIKVHKQINTEA
jgi:saccharopine dehydrogenase-like NADP-dependent oxidoreductase